MTGLKETLEARIAALAPGLEIYRPEGPGPFPVVIQLHGCGGKKALQGRWGRAAREAGWVAIVVDSYRHRKISPFEAYSTVCTGMRLWGRERAGDLFAAMEWVRWQSWAMADRIVVAGWSHGGWTAMDAMTMTPGEEIEAATGLSGIGPDPLGGLVGAFLVYPYAGPGSLARVKGLQVDVSPLAIVGARDVIVGGRSLAKALAGIETPGKPIEVAVFENATHAFDEEEARDLRTRYDPVLTARAQDLYRGYLKARTASPAHNAAAV